MYKIVYKLQKYFSGDKNIPNQAKRKVRLL